MEKHRAETLQVTQQREQLNTLHHELETTIAKSTSLESIIYGLRQERELWSKELALQGAALASDQGRLENQVKQLEADLAGSRASIAALEETLRVKNKMLNDQGDALRKVKQSALDREREQKDDQDRAARKLNDMQGRLNTETELSQQLQHDLDAEREKKTKLKAALSNVSSDLATARCEQEKLVAALRQKDYFLHQVQGQIDAAHAMFAEKETRLQQERQKAIDAFLQVEAKLQTSCAELSKTGQVLRDCRAERDAARHDVQAQKSQVGHICNLKLTKKKKKTKYAADT